MFTNSYNIWQHSRAAIVVLLTSCLQQDTFDTVHGKGACTCLVLHMGFAMRSRPAERAPNLHARSQSRLTECPQALRQKHCDCLDVNTGLVVSSWAQIYAYMLKAMRPDAVHSVESSLNAIQEAW